MELDADHHHSPSPPPHPLSILHDQLRSYITATLPELVGEAAAQLRHAREVEERERRNVSVHARSAARSPPIPEEAEWKTWSPKESILWLDKALPLQATMPTTAAVKLAEFITPYGERGGRKGESWSRGDWKTAADAVERLCGGSVASELRIAVEQAFLQPIALR